MADTASISMFQLNSGAWLVEPAGLPAALSDARVFADREKAATYAAQLGEKHHATAIIMPPNPALNS